MHAHRSPDANEGRGEREMQGIAVGAKLHCVCKHVLCKKFKWESLGTPDCRVPSTHRVVFCTNNDRVREFLFVGTLGSCTSREAGLLGETR